MKKIKGWYMLSNDGFIIGTTTHIILGNLIHMI